MQPTSRIPVTVPAVVCLLLAALAVLPSCRSSTPVVPPLYAGHPEPKDVPAPIVKIAWSPPPGNPLVLGVEVSQTDGWTYVKDSHTSVLVMGQIRGRQVSHVIPYDPTGWQDGNYQIDLADEHGGCADLLRNGTQRCFYMTVPCTHPTGGYKWVLASWEEHQ